MPNGGFAGPFVVLMTLLASMYAPAILPLVRPVRRLDRATRRARTALVLTV